MEAEEVLRRLLSRALRNEYIVDPQGREVRKHHPVITEVKTADGIKKQSAWYTIFDAQPEKMRASLQLRRRAALADVMQLKFDFDSYNENNRQGDSLAPMDFDFNKDIDELSQPVTYPSEAPNENDGEETEEDLVL